MDYFGQDSGTNFCVDYWLFGGVVSSADRVL